MRDKLEEAFEAAFPGPSAEVTCADERPCKCNGCSWIKVSNRFTRLLDAEAWLDAAMMLVPEGWSLGLGDLRGRNPIVWRAHIRDHNPASLTHAGHSHICFDAEAPTPAEALLAAIEKART